ncbi:hypothetical protein DBY21_09435 [Candidatus Gastranaerophilales bacterium]|nr:MAG: hypothetical protein DBY21_09435 [Candidatus Gastranaerophilales bacterium]
MKKLLFITPRVPIPAISGGLIGTLHSLKYLCKNFKVDYISFYNEDEHNINKIEKELKLIGINKVYLINFVTKQRNLTNILAAIQNNLPLSIFRNKSEEMYKQVKQIANEYDIIYSDHWLSMQFIPDDYPKTVILKEHNAEYVMWERLEKQERNLIKKVYLKQEVKKIKNYECKICNRATKVLTVTEEDKNHLFRIGVPKQKISMLPAIIINNNPTNTTPFAERENSIMYVGTMSWDANIDGLSYFLRNIYPDIKKHIPNIKFYIIGKNPPELIKRYSYSDPSIIITGFVEDLKEYYNKCKLFIVYLRYGSGIKIKILETLAMGLPVISNNIGLEGIKTKATIKCKTDIDFANQIISLLKDKNKLEQMSKYAYSYIEKNYSEELYNKFFNMLQQT